MDDSSAEWFTQEMMTIYDLATEIATKEGKSHREAFNLLCQYLELEWKLDQQQKVLEEKEKVIHGLNQEIRDRLGTLAILKAIQEGKVGRG